MVSNKDSFLRHPVQAVNLAPAMCMKYPPQSGPIAGIFCVRNRAAKGAAAIDPIFELIVRLNASPFSVIWTAVACMQQSKYFLLYPLARGNATITETKQGDRGRLPRQSERSRGSAGSL